MMKKFALLIAAGTLLSACDSKFVPGPDIVLEPHYKQATKTRGNIIAPETHWWYNYGDANLNRLVEEALAANLDIEQARERIRAARFTARIVKSEYLPQLNASSAATWSGNRTKVTRVTPIYGVVPGTNNVVQTGATTSTSRVTTDTSNVSKTLAGSWKFDFFGGRASADAQAANVEASKEALNAVRLDVIAGVTSAYLNAQGLGEQIRIAQRALSVQNDTADITKAKLEAGSVSALDSTRATAQASLTAADIPSLQQARAQAINQIAILLGKEPAAVDNLFTKYKPVRRPKVRFAEGIPADLLRNRPDVRQSEWLLKYYVSQIGVAEADLYPAITLSGTLNAQLHNSTPTTSWSFGPSVSIPIFDRGALKAQVNLSKSDAKVQYFAYKQTVLTGVQEVEDALVALRSEQQRHQRLAAAVGDYTKAESLARQLNESGTTEFKDVLDAQSSLYSAQLQLAASATQLSINYVVLCQALGGGWAGEEPVMTEDTLKLAAKAD